MKDGPATAERWWVCFLDPVFEMAWWQRFLKPGFRHVTLLRYSPETDAWIMVDFHWKRILIDTIRPRLAEGMIAKTVAVPVRARADFLPLWPVFTCVGLSARVLGHRRIAFTPWQLYRQLVAMAEEDGRLREAAARAGAAGGSAGQAAKAGEA